MSARMFMWSVLFTNMLFRNTQVPPETATRAAVISSLPMISRNIAVPLVAAQETKNQIVENQSLQATVRSKLDTDLYVAKLDQELARGDGGLDADEVKNVLTQGLDPGQLQLVIEAARRNNKTNLLAALEAEPSTSSISADLGRSLTQYFEQLTRQLIEQRPARQLMEQRPEMAQSEQQRNIVSTQPDKDRKKT